MESPEARRVIEIPEHWSECHMRELPFSPTRIDMIAQALAVEIMPFSFRVTYNPGEKSLTIHNDGVMRWLPALEAIRKNLSEYEGVQISFLFKVPDQPPQLGFKDRIRKFLGL